MPAQLSKGHTFHNGDTSISAATLNTFVDNGTILPGAILEQVAGPPTTDDSFLYADGTNGGLKRCTLQQVLNQIPTNSPASTPALRRLGVGANMAAPGNDNRFPSPIRGIRLGNGPAADTIAAPKDTIFAPIDLHTQLGVIDWDLADVFYETLGNDKTYTFANLRAGRRILVVLKTAGHAVTFPTLLGDAPPTTGNTGNIYYIEFTNTTLGTSGYLLNEPEATDTDIHPVDLGSGTIIDWSAGDTFHASLSGDRTYTFSNVTLGKSITVLILLNGHTVTMPTGTGTTPTVGSGTLMKTFYFTNGGAITSSYCVAN